MQSSDNNPKLERSCHPENFGEIVERVINPARNGNKATYHGCCRSFSKRCRQKSKKNQDPLHEHLDSTNVKAIFRLDKKLSVEEAWKQFIEWSEKSNLPVDLQSGFLVNQKVCLKRVEDLQKKASETELLRLYCLYTNPVLKDALLKQQTEEISKLQVKLVQKEQESLVKEQKNADKDMIIRRQKMLIEKLEANFISNYAGEHQIVHKMDDSLDRELYATFQRLLDKCNKQQLLKELIWLEEFVGEPIAPALKQEYHDPSVQLKNFNLLQSSPSN